MKSLRLKESVELADTSKSVENKINLCDFILKVLKALRLSQNFVIRCEINSQSSVSHTSICTVISGGIAHIEHSLWNKNAFDNEIAAKCEKFHILSRTFFLHPLEQSEVDAQFHRFHAINSMKNRIKGTFN